MDINNDFLHGNLNEEVHMKIPDGYHAPSYKVCRLKKSLYDLKQASREWNCALTKHLVSYGFVQTLKDHYFFIRKIENLILILLVYVDDLLLAGPNALDIDYVKASLYSAFTIKDLGPFKYYFGLEITQSADEIFVSQRKYVEDQLADAGISLCKPVSIPLPFSCKLNLNDSQVLSSPDMYMRIIDRLLYLRFTKPGITRTTQTLS